MSDAAKRHPLTKIVATIGPKSEDPTVLEAMIRAGVSTFRLNFSHGTQQQHRIVYHRIREIAARLGLPTTILQDLQGPKLRIGELEGDAPIEIEDGDTLVICTTPVSGTASRISTSYEGLGEDVRVGNTILIDDGLIELRVTDVRSSSDHGAEAVTQVVHGGLLKPHKGINLPGTNISAPALTGKDLEDMAFGIELGVDMIALSFVRSPQDVIDAKARIRDFGGTQPLISKIEKPQAVQSLEAIVQVSDGLMVARGDLGVELSADQVPLIQKRLIRLANQAGKPVITATQMLESMIHNPRPTRAEASDIANAILDGTDAVMLSGETAVGDWPVKTVETMARIARTIEGDASWRQAMQTISAGAPHVDGHNESLAVSRAASSLAINARASAIIVLTATGATAERISQQRPGVPILAFADHADVAARLSLWHGLVPVHEPLSTDISALIEQVESGVRRLGYAGPGDTVVIVGSVPRAGGTRAVFLEIHPLV